MLILLNGTIRTLDPDRPRVQALAIQGDRIVMAGPEDEVRPLIGPGSEVVDLQGKLALPGFIDAHLHLTEGGLQLARLDLSRARTREEFIQRVQEGVRGLPPGAWVQGGGWDEEKFPNGELPSKEWIDRETPHHPVFLTRYDGHTALASSQALSRAGITRFTSDPPGGLILRDPASGEPTGILRERALEEVVREIPPPSEAERREGLRRALQEAARRGITSVHDIATWDEVGTYRDLLRKGELTLRVFALTPLSDWGRLMEAEGLRRGDAWLRLGAVKGYADGSLGSRTAWLFEPYADDASHRGLPDPLMDSPADLAGWLSAADQAGLQVAFHAIGDRALSAVLDCFEEVERRNGPRDRRFRIEHAQHVRPEDFPRFRRLGVIASMQPYHAIDDGRWAERVIGRERARTSYAWRTMLDHGVPLAFGSDWPVSPLNPLKGLYAAITRQTLDGRHPGGWVAQERISLMEAIRAYTLGGAYASFEEGLKGSLVVGKRADVVVLSRDILQGDPEDLLRAEVVLTLVGGKIVYRSPGGEGV